MTIAREQHMYDALRRIARQYQTPAELRRHSERQYGVPYEEALEMAYENIQAEAAAAIKGMRRPAVAAEREGSRG